MSGATVLDAGVLIGFFDSNDAHSADAVAAVTRLVEAEEHLLISTATQAEVLTRPMQRGLEHAASMEVAIDQLPHVELVDVDRLIARGAAQVRATYPRMKLADALVIATAQSAGSCRILTTDGDFARVPNAVQLHEFVN